MQQAMDLNDISIRREHRLQHQVAKLARCGANCINSSRTPCIHGDGGLQHAVWMKSRRRSTPAANDAMEKGSRMTRNVALLTGIADYRALQLDGARADVSMVIRRRDGAPKERGKHGLG